MGTEIGHAHRAAVKKQTGAWGASPALVLGANDGFEFNTESLRSNASLVMNEGITGSPYRRPGSPGNLTPSGDVELDLYYRCSALRMLAAAFGADAVAALGGGAHRHDLTQAGSMLGTHFTLGFLGAEAVREFPHSKVTGARLRWAEDGQRGKLTASIAAFDENVNVGSPDDDFVVVSVAAANGALTVTPAAQADFTPSPIYVTKVAGITAITLAIVAVDRFGDQYTKTVTVSDFTTEVWTDTESVRRVLSITISGLGGTGNIKVGVTNGKNNASTLSGVSTVADRDVSLFTQMRVWMNAQGGADFVDATDEQFVSAVEIGLALTMDTRVTTKHRRRIEEPELGGGGWPTATIGFNWSAFTDRNRQRLIDQIAKNQIKAKVELTGPPIASSGFPHKITCWLNGLQLAEGDVNVGGPGVIAFNVSGEAHSVVAVPTGFPAAHTRAVMIQIQNGEATGYLA
jgi:hypothetical protein